MTVPGRTALDNLTRPGPDPDCPVCLGTGTDLVFETSCTECWSRRDANVRDARDRIAARWTADYERRHDGPAPRTAMRTAPRTAPRPIPTSKAAVRQAADATLEQWHDNRRRALADWKRRHPLTMRFARMMNP